MPRIDSEAQLEATEERLRLILEKYEDRTNKKTFLYPLYKRPMHGWITGLANFLIPGLGYLAIRQYGKAASSFVVFVVLAAISIISLVVFLVLSPIAFILIIASVVISLTLLVTFLLPLLLPFLVLVVLFLLVPLIVFAALIFAVLVHQTIAGVDCFLLTRHARRGNLIMAGECGWAIAKPLAAVTSRPTFVYDLDDRSVPAISRRCNPLAQSIRNYRESALDRELGIPSYSSVMPELESPRVKRTVEPNAPPPLYMQEAAAGIPSV
ncbi:hypothetical protein J8273_2434 [Carpediemonas membranifera]|uniref:Uncharacterized protein n=1 Tax=Carpediemonas membranifera TaxID=201153 RepID=A0A8J6E5P5_9EUKA|nr:hypothetical protein J8273_2434 [Carpediemonas membranifera]|eukprot:KAG9396082.1 hypothetical protein J8273_2434 [Carpediemonas membranifera]